MSKNVESFEPSRSTEMSSVQKLGVPVFFNNNCCTWLINHLGPDRSYVIHGSYERNNCPEAKGLVDNANFRFTEKLIGPLNADRPLWIYQL